MIGASLSFLHRKVDRKTVEVDVVCRDRDQRVVARVGWHLPPDARRKGTAVKDAENGGDGQ